MELEELIARCRRLVLAGDENHRLLERRLHQGLQQELVALAVKLQLASALVNEPTALKELLDELALDVQQAVDEAAQLAQRMYPPLLDAGSLGAALRAAASSAGVEARVAVAIDQSSPEAARSIYSCWLEALDNTAAGTRAEITVRDTGGAIAFEVVATGDLSPATLERLRDRVEALAGRLKVESQAARGTRVSAVLPASD